MRTDRQAYRHDEANNRFSQFRESDQKVISRQFVTNWNGCLWNLIMPATFQMFSSLIYHENHITLANARIVTQNIWHM